MVHTYNVASSLLKRLGDCELALLAADRAVRTAATLDEPVLVAAASYRLANVLLCANRFDRTRDVALHAADSIEPGKAQAPISVASWGGLLLTAAVATAKGGDGPGAWELLGEARAASRMLGMEYADIHTIFGPTNVAVHGVQIAAELGDGRDAIERAKRVDVGRFPTSLAERRGQLLLDMAHGYALTGEDGEATGGADARRADGAGRSAIQRGRTPARTHAAQPGASWRDTWPTGACHSHRTSDLDGDRDVARH